MYKSTLRPSEIRASDRRYERSRVPSGLSAQVDLRKWDSAIEDQGRLGSCSALAMTSAYELMLNQINSYVELSDLFIYYNTRLPLNEQRYDLGATIRDTVKSVETYGVCREELWPYDITKFDDAPTPEAYQDGVTRKLSDPVRLFSLVEGIDCLNSGRPFICGMEIFWSFLFLNSQNAMVRMPLTDLDVTQGYHAMSVVGYDLEQQHFIAKNSFGTDWGDAGYCYISFAYAQAYMMENWAWDLLLNNQL